MIRKNLVLLLFLIGASGNPSLHSDEPTESRKNVRTVQAVLAQYCNRCHNEKKHEADLVLTKLNYDLVAGPDAETWHDVLNKLNVGEMPPEDEPQPTDQQRNDLVNWLTAELRRAADAGQSNRAVLRRLTRYEYNNTMRDLLGLELNFAKDLPPDSTSADGFKNDGSALRMSPLQMEFYLAAARNALRKAIVVGEKPQVFEHHAEKSVTVKRVKGAVSNRLGPNGRFIARLMEYPTEGEIRVRVKANAIVPNEAGYPRMQVTIGLRSDVLAPEASLGEADVVPSEDGMQTFEFRGRIEDYPLPGHNPKYPGVLITIWNTYGDGKSAPKPKKKKGEAPKEDPTQPIIVIESVDFEGPVWQSWPPASHTRILFKSDLRSDEDAYAREVLTRFMTRAYRRPVSKQEVESIKSLFDKIRPRYETFEEAIRESLAMVLISPDFLYHIESDGIESRPLNDFEIASRLSYFLWSTMPDETLMKLAETGKLRDKKVVAQQVQRMIEDSRSWNFVQHFTDQWLNLSGLDRIAINPEFYPKFDDRLKNEMRKETQHFFAEILYKNLSAMNLVDSDFAMLNRPLAKHYGIDGPRGSDFERVELAAEDRRGGLLGHGSMLLVNSTGEQSHPIKRGVWLLERLLDDPPPPPPPPPDVPDLKSDEPDFAGLSLRKQLEIHRQKAACNSCHRRIDPWGIPFENFDAVGVWRTTTLTKTGKKKQQVPVENSATLPTGEEISGVEELKAYLLKNERGRFSRALVKKLLTYACGRGMHWNDKQSIEELADEFAAHDYRLADLIAALVQSDPFITK